MASHGAETWVTRFRESTATTVVRMMVSRFAVSKTNCLFGGVDKSGKADMSDAVYLIAHICVGGPAPREGVM